MNYDPRSFSRTPLLLAFAVFLGMAVTLGEHLAFAMSLGRRVDFDEADALAMNAALTAFPFIVLAFWPRLATWLFAICATIAVHGWWLTQGVAYQRSPNGTGVPILGAALMLFSPLAILLLAGALNWAMSRSKAEA